MCKYSVSALILVCALAGYSEDITLSIKTLATIDCGPENRANLAFEFAGEQFMVPFDGFANSQLADRPKIALAYGVADAILSDDKQPVADAIRDDWKKYFPDVVESVVSEYNYRFFALAKDYRDNLHIKCAIPLGDYTMIILTLENMPEKYSTTSETICPPLMIEEIDGQNYFMPFTVVEVGASISTY